MERAVLHHYRNRRLLFNIAFGVTNGADLMYVYCAFIFHIHFMHRWYKPTTFTHLKYSSVFKFMFTNNLNEHIKNLVVHSFLKPETSSKLRCFQLSKTKALMSGHKSVEQFLTHYFRFPAKSTWNVIPSIHWECWHAQFIQCNSK
jgi:hypothetical protein